MCTKFPIKRKIFSIFYSECLTWVILGRNFLEKTIGMFEIGTLQKQPPRGMQRINRRTPMPKCDFNKVAKQHLWVAACHAWICEFGIWKKYCHIWNQLLWISQDAKFDIKQNKFGIKITLFEGFLAATLSNYFHIWKQHLRICEAAKFHSKQENFKLWIKNALFGQNFKNYCHNWNQLFRICLKAKFHVKEKA